MRREVKVGTVSWINETPNPVTVAAEAMLLEPAWVVKTYIGLVATSNPAPSDREDDFLSLQKGRQFRAAMYCHFSFDEDEAQHTVSNLRVIESFRDPGWTPPFAMTKFPSSIFSFDTEIYSFKWHAGESSPLSMISRERRHPNSAITGVPAGEVVLINGLIKFRAGKHTDDLGINSVKAPYHVPWVWCEMLLTYAKGMLKLYGRGSVFPSHAWYLDGKRVARSTQAADTSFPKSTIVPRWVPRLPGGSPIMNLPNPLHIDVQSMRIYPVLSAGASSAGPQTALDADASLTTPVDGHPHTASGITMVTN